MHAVVFVVLKLFVYSCLSKCSPSGLMLHVVKYSTQNKIYMALSKKRTRNRTLPKQLGPNYLLEDYFMDTF